MVPLRGMDKTKFMRVVATKFNKIVQQTNKLAVTRVELNPLDYHLFKKQMGIKTRDFEINRVMVMPNMLVVRNTIVFVRKKASGIVYTETVEVR